MTASFPSSLLPSLLFFSSHLGVQTQKMTNTAASVICRWSIQSKLVKCSWNLSAKHADSSVSSAETSTVRYLFECVSMSACVRLGKGPYITLVSGDEPLCISLRNLRETQLDRERCLCVCVLMSRCRFPRHIIPLFIPKLRRAHTQSCIHTLTHTHTHAYWLHKFSNILGARKLALT